MAPMPIHPKSIEYLSTGAVVPQCKFKWSVCEQCNVYPKHVWTISLGYPRLSLAHDCHCTCLFLSVFILFYFLPVLDDLKLQWRCSKCCVLTAYVLLLLFRIFFCTVHGCIGETSKEIIYSSVLLVINFGMVC